MTTTKPTKAKRPPKSPKTPDALDQRFAEGVPNLNEDKELVAEIRRLVDKFTQDVKGAAEKRKIDVDVIIQISPKKN